MNSNRVGGSRYHDFVKVGAERYLLFPARARDRHIDRHERRIGDLDAAFFDGCFEPEITRVVAFQDGGKQGDHCRPRNRRSLIMPDTIARNVHIDITTKPFIAGTAARGILWMNTLKSV